MKDITAVSLILTENCNLGCSYCFENGKHTDVVMNKRVIEKIIPMVFRGAKKNNKKPSFTLFGGEPLMVGDRVNTVLTTILANKNKYQVDPSIDIITNGTILTEEIQNILLAFIDIFDIHIQISLDGIEYTHDINRKYKNGDSSFKDIENNIHILKNIYKNKPDLLSIHSVITPDTIEYMYESYEYFKYNMGIKHIWFLPLADATVWVDEDVKKYWYQNTRIFNDIFECFLQNGIQELNNYSPMSRYSRCGSSTDKPCGVGYGYYGIAPNGDIYPCHQFYFMDNKSDMWIGSIFDIENINKGVTDIFEKYSGRDLSCGVCDHQHCYRCLANNYTINGSIFSQVQGNYCDMMKVDQEFQNRIKILIDSQNGDNRNNQEGGSFDIPGMILDLHDRLIHIEKYLTKKDEGDR